MKLFILFLALMFAKFAFASPEIKEDAPLVKTEIIADYSESFVVMHSVEYQNLYDRSVEPFNCLIRDVKINSFAVPSSRYHILHQNLVDKKGNGDLSSVLVARYNILHQNLIRMLRYNNDKDLNI